MKHTLTKHIIKLNDLKHLCKDESSCIELKKKCAGRFQLLPGCLRDIKKSVKEYLQSIISTYDSQLDGIILNFKNVKIKPLVSLTEDINVTINYLSDVYIFKPQKDKILKGIVNKKSQEHIGCLVHKLFNATISCPKDLNIEEWPCNQLNIGDEILFKVSDLSMGRRLPFIKGCLIESDTEIRTKECSDINEANIPDTQDLSNQESSFKKITKLLNPDFSSSDEESLVSKKRTSIKSHFPTSSNKRKLFFRNTHVNINENEIDSPVSKKRKMQHSMSNDG